MYFNITDFSEGYGSGTMYQDMNFSTNQELSLYWNMFSSVVLNKNEPEIKNLHLLGKNRNIKIGILKSNINASGKTVNSQKKDTARLKGGKTWK